MDVIGKLCSCCALIIVLNLLDVHLVHCEQLRLECGGLDQDQVGVAEE